MSTAPDLTFRDKTDPNVVVSQFTYVQTKDGGTNLPVNQGENSDNIFFRVYNNWAGNSGIATALNFHLTTYDGATAASHTAVKSTIAEQWIHILQNGYGEGVSKPGTFTSYVGTDTPVGGATNRWVAGVGSDGTSGQSYIRAGSTGDGVGFLEIKTYASVPANAPNTTTVFVLTAEYEWTS